MTRFACTTLLVLLPFGRVSAEPTIRLEHTGRAAYFVVTGIDPDNLAALAKVERKPDDWTTLFAVYVDNGGAAEHLAILGSYRVEAQTLRFEPRFPPAPGVRYRAVFDPARLPKPSDPAAKRVTTTIEVPKPTTAPTVVEHVYPTRDRLPENLLKFYLHFSAPMSRGEAYKHIHLLDATGKPIDAPFLELIEELWDPSDQRFTLFIDPGRIKQGLKPREDVGPVLEAGKEYTLVIDRDWSDAAGNPLKAPYRKRFQAVSADEQSPDPQTWRIQPPPEGGKQPLEVRSPKSLDHALFERVLHVVGPGGMRISGTVAIADEETCWRFTPERPWRAGDYQLVIETTLEDLAGNRIGRPFEVDVFRRVQSGVKTETVRRPFTIRAAPSP